MDLPLNQPLEQPMDQSVDRPTGPLSLSGDLFRRMVVAGAGYVEQHVDAINAMNVFPVPDGDTGINMLLTLRSANDSNELPEPGQGSVADVSKALARGALLGARGNSGVILSQYMKGMSVGLAGCDECDGPQLAAALAAASSASYQAVGKPVEGTMLTVMRAAAEAVQPADGLPSGVLRGALQAAERALAQTPDQLPVLKEAGVVDAGGQGVVAFLAGCLGYLEGRAIALEIGAPAGRAGEASVSHAFLEHTEDEMYGYCTQFIIQGHALDVEAVRALVSSMAASTVVVGDEQTVRVHAHAEDPGPLLSMGVGFGAVDQINIQNMDVQHQDFMGRHGYAPADTALAVIAVAPGGGIERVFRDLGAHAVVPGGQTMNPSAAELLEAVRRSGAEHTVILPNNKNILLAANQAAELSEGAVTVVPSTSVPQGVAALLALNPDLDPAGNIDAMVCAAADARSGEVTVAVRSATINGIPIAEGDAMALLDGDVVATAASLHEALMSLVERAAPEDGALVTLYYGADLTADEAHFAANGIASRFEGVETEVVEGGQPHYHYLVSFD